MLPSPPSRRDGQTPTTRVRGNTSAAAVSPSPPLCRNGQTPAVPVRGITSWGFPTAGEPRMQALRRMHGIVAAGPRAQAKFFLLMRKLHYRRQRELW